ncbi:MAG TPA: NAD(P)-dependent oxidoreductase [Pyrinomonadaceae bacterium]|nr:NAD(P)-dependent oxidoreductase [Pyrinomonadaceae bacterium]
MPENYRSPLDIEQIEANFAEINPAMTQAEALAEANRCLYCYDAPCTRACPTHIDVPSFIKKISTGNVMGAARVIFDANPIGATCARVCPVEVLCEGACVEKTLVNKPIEIGRLQRFATDHAMASDKQIFTKGDPNGRSVGIVGSGPAGLSCAAYLARLGYDVTVYEKRDKPGGLDTYGMAEYKMPQAVSLAEAEHIAAMGVKFLLNTEIGRRSETPAEAEGEAEAKDETAASAQVVSFADLENWHDAIFLATGLGKTKTLNIPGEYLEGVYDALEFIEKIKTREWLSIPVGSVVVVIGAGNTAIDAATQAKRLGAKSVTIVYRRTAKEMPAYDYEYELAKQDGVDFVWNAEPYQINTDDDRTVQSLECLQLDIGRARFRINCDMIIKAVGQNKTTGFFTDVCGIAVDDAGRVSVNQLMQTSKPNVFAGGDCVNGGAEAVDAAQMGKLAACAIDEWLPARS